MTDRAPAPTAAAPKAAPTAAVAEAAPVDGPPAVAAKGGICVILNTGSGRNSDETDPCAAAMAVLGADTALRRIGNGMDIAETARAAVAEGYGTIVAAGGDGTIMTVASQLVGTGCRLGVLPLGTFNYFARGLDIPEDLSEAAELIRSGPTRPLSLGEVNGRVFLNNASLGVYPAILKERESVYRRWGRRRIAAYWSVVKTFARFQRPMRMTIEVEGESRRLRTPLVFVARSQFQLEHFELEGADCIARGQFAVFISPDRGRIGLFKQAWRLVRHSMKAGRDFELICTERLTIHTRRPRKLIACDGEKLWLHSPLVFAMHKDAVQVIAPPPADATRSAPPLPVDAPAATA